MAIKNFIPNVWSENLYTELDKQYIAVANCNREFEGDIKNIDGLLYMVLRGTADYVSQCSRCLAPVDMTLDFTIKEVFSKTELENENDDVIILNSNEIDLKDIAEQGFCCALPIANLCSEDCKGLCPVCGCNLNTESCDCEVDNVDPRLAALKDFLK